MRRSPSLTDQNPLALDAGKLRHKVQIQQQSNVQDADTGEPVQTWNTILTTMASILTQSSREVYQTGQAGQFVAQVTHIVKLRWPGAGIAIAGGMRVVFGSRIFNVQTAENVQERNRVINLMCLEVNGGAGCS